MAAAAGGQTQVPRRSLAGSQRGPVPFRSTTAPAALLGTAQVSPLGLTAPSTAMHAAAGQRLEAVLQNAFMVLEA